MGPLFHVFLPLSRWVGSCACRGRLRFRCGRLVQALPSLLRWSGSVFVGLRFFFPCPFRVCPFWARCVVLVFSLSIFFCVPLFASWLSNFHFIFIFISLSLSFHPPRCCGVCVCVYHLYRCRTSYSCRGPLGNIAVSGQRRRCNVPV